jgi:quercetin dioxygenase-like cupin family protein
VPHPKNTQIIPESNGRYVSIAGNNYRIIISGNQTDGKFAVIDMQVPPGGGPVPHAHESINETFLVIEGQVEFRNESGKFSAKKGDFVNIPLGGAIHSFKNISNETARLICTVMPSGLEEFFIEVDVLMQNQPMPPDQTTVEKLNALSKKYGQILFPADYLD